MGEQSFRNQGVVDEERKGWEAASAASELPSFRPVAPPTKGAAEQQGPAGLEAAGKPPFDKKHFVVRENHRNARIASSLSPSLAVTGRTETGKGTAKNRLGRAFARSSLVLIIGACLGYVCSYLLPGPARPVTQEIARGPSDSWSSPTLSAFVDQAERQITEHRLEAPAGDNALETYRRIVAKSPGSAEARAVGEHLSLAFWSLGVAATQRGDWAEATRYFDTVKTLPVPRTSLVSAEAPLPEAAADPALSNVVLPKVAADAKARANGPTPSPGATAAANEERAPEAAVVALKRGDQAMRSGDIVSARRFYEYAASAGIAEAATAAGQTYDPAFLKTVGVRGLKANPETARGWYEKAARQGDPRAAQLLQFLNQN
jgi:hypothetical protein